MKVTNCIVYDSQQTYEKIEKQLKETHPNCVLKKVTSITSKEFDEHIKEITSGIINNTLMFLNNKGEEPLQYISKSVLENEILMLTPKQYVALKQSFVGKPLKIIPI